VEQNQVSLFELSFKLFFFLKGISSSSLHIFNLHVTSRKHMLQGYGHQHTLDFSDKPSYLQSLTGGKMLRAPVEHRKIVGKMEEKKNEVRAH
jgi:hypothetical protein